MRWASIILYFTLLAYGLSFAYAPTIFTGFRHLQADSGDTVLNHYFLEHTLRYVSQSDYKAELWSPLFFYPQKDVLTFSDNHFGSAPIYWLLRCFFRDVPAYQVWMLLGFALNFAAMAVVLRWFGLRHAYCAIGAFLFAFGLPHVQHIGHQQLCYRLWTPFAIWHCGQFLREPSGRKLLYCLMCVAAQFVTGVYVGWFLAFGIGFLGICAVAFDRTARARIVSFVRRRPISAILPFVAALLMVAPVAIPYLRVNRDFQRNFNEVLNGTPRWNSWLNAPLNTLWRPLMQRINLGKGGEFHLFGGMTFFILFAACIVVIARKQSADRLFIKSALAAVLLMGLLSLSYWMRDGYGGGLWYYVYSVVPSAKAIRVVARIYLIIYPLLLIAGLLALQSLLESPRISNRMGMILVVGLILLAAAENFFPQMDDKTRSFAHADFYRLARSTSEQMRDVDAAFGVPDPDKPFYEHETMMMWAGLYANVPVINGYSGRHPKDYPAWESAPTPEQLRQWLGANWDGKVAIIPSGERPKRIVWRLRGDGEAERVLE